MKKNKIPKKTEKISYKGKKTLPYPTFSLEESIKIPLILKEKNGGNQWSPKLIANALNFSESSNKFYYLAASSRDFGFTLGGRDSEYISLTEKGRKLVYAASRTEELKLKKAAFFGVDLFKKVFHHYNGCNLPEMKYLGNTLQEEFKLSYERHEEFANLFKKNCEYLNLKSENNKFFSDSNEEETVILAEPEKNVGLHLFVIMPFTEHDPQTPKGYFNEVLESLIVPAGREAGFRVSTANRKGTDVIHTTIVRDLLNADLVLADLTEHNPNVLFELGMRMREDKPVVLIRSKGTGPIFDVDNLLRVYDYNPNLWKTTVENDLPKLIEHIKETWRSKDKSPSYLKILKGDSNEFVVMGQNNSSFGKELTH